MLSFKTVDKISRDLVSFWLVLRKKPNFLIHFIRRTQWICKDRSILRWKRQIRSWSEKCYNCCRGKVFNHYAYIGGQHSLAVISWAILLHHDDVIKWKHFRVTGPFAGNSPVTGEIPAQNQWRRVLMFSSIRAWINSWINNREAGD